MKILITGSSGFIGSYLIKALSKKHTVIGVDIESGHDLKDLDTVLNLPDVDIVYHLAMVNNTSAFYTSPYTIIENSYLPLHNIIKRYKNTPIIYTSSSETYAGGFSLGTTPIPTPEDVPLVIDDISNTRWSYASSKILGESMLFSANKQYGTPFKIIRYHNVYGIGQKHHFIPEFIDRCLNQEFILYGADEKRSFCYIEDAIEATILVAEQAEFSSITNIGSNSENKIIDVANLILKELKLNVDLEVRHAKKGSVKRRLPDITKLKKLGFNPKWSIEQGIKEIVNGIINK